MKPLILAISALTISATALAQYNTGVMIRFRGNTSQRVTLDNRTYTSDDYQSSGNNGNRTVTITDIGPGSHTLRVDYSNRRRTGTTTTFTLREGYKMNISVNGNGSVQLQERRNRDGNTGTYHQAMSDANYATLIRNIRNTRGNAGKYNYANSIVTTTGNYFTSAQVRGILGAFYGEAYRLQLAKNAYSHVIDPTSFNVVYDMLGTTAARVELQNYVNANGNTTGTNPGTVTPGSSNAGLNPMDASTYNQLYNTVNSRYNQSQRLSDLNTIFGNTSYTFSAQQVSQFINLVTDQANRLQLAKNAFRLTADPANYGIVANLLTSTYNRSNLEAYIRSYTNNPNYVFGQGSTSYPGTGNNYSAMSDAQYNTLVQTVQGKWLPGAKMAELVNIFNNTSYYFSATQARQLISLVSDENNRLQLAKSSYRSVVDPSNISIYYDLFTSTAARNDFDAYVRANGGTNTGTYPTNNNNGYRTAMGVSEYNALVEDVKSKWLPGAKMATLTNIMNNTMYNFSVAQAHDLIILVSDEANRLQLAKSGFARLVDPTNYTNLYDLFTLQQSRDDLDVYARSYR